MVEIRDELRRAADRLARDPRVLAVYGFGSRARGEAGPRSDVDVAVLLERRLDLREELRLRAEVVDELRRDDVDLVVLNQAPPLLRYEVVAAGRRLFARDEETADLFEERAARECFDTAHLRSVQQRLAREARE
jgi:predicted nucleotidyltransferase